MGRPKKASSSTNLTQERRKKYKADVPAQKSPVRKKAVVGRKERNSTVSARQRLVEIRSKANADRSSLKNINYEESSEESDEESADQTADQSDEESADQTAAQSGEGSDDESADEGGRDQGHEINMVESPASSSDQSDYDGFPTDRSLLQYYTSHIANHIWKGNSSDRLLTVKPTAGWIGRWVLGGECKFVQEKVNDAGFLPIINYVYRRPDDALVSAFAERYYPETNTFHLPFGEMMIRLEDVKHIVDLPIDGKAVHGVTSTAMQSAFVLKLMKRTLGLEPNEAKNALKDGCLKTVKLAWLAETFSNSKNNMSQKRKEYCARAYLLYVVGSCICPDKSGNRVNVQYLQCFENLDEVKSYSWGTACLANLMHQLCSATRFKVKQMGGCFTILQVWIYEHFPDLYSGWNKNTKFEDGWPLARKWVPRPSSNKRKRLQDLKALRGRIDELQSTDVIWDSYAHSREHYPNHPVSYYSGMVVCFEVTATVYPQRILRQLGYIQSIPEPPQPLDVVKSMTTNKHFTAYYGSSAAHMWSNWQNHILSDQYRNGVTVPDQTVDDYMAWYLTVSHPRVVNPIHPSREEETDVVEPPKDANSILQRMKSRLKKFADALHICGGGENMAMSPSLKEKMVKKVKMIADDIESDDQAE